MDQMIGEMVQLERLRTGTPRVHRRWVPVAQIRQAVDETLRPWAMPREIDVKWDGMDEVAETVFADPAMLRRLLVNLITNSIRVTAEGGGVLIRLQSVCDGDTIRWSVLDQGRGISESDLQWIADREVTFDGGEGLGLAISRQLAALHFSALQIRSRLGSGTQVSFETAAAGPRSVAQTWSHWRVARGRARQELMKGERTSRHCTFDSVQQIRLDPPLVEIEVSHEASAPRCKDRFAAGTVSVGATVSREAADAFDELLQSQLLMFDLVYRVNQRRWVWAFDVDPSAAQNRIEPIIDTAQARIPNIRMSWSEAQTIPVDGRKTHSRLSDLLVRETLSTSASNHILDKNEVRLGTPPIVPRKIAADRLDAELRRLSSKLRTQTETLQQQARRLRLKE